VDRRRVRGPPRAQQKVVRADLDRVHPAILPDTPSGAKRLHRPGTMRCQRTRSGVLSRLHD
jgi:hypothetical protein